MLVIFIITELKCRQLITILSLNHLIHKVGIIIIPKSQHYSEDRKW